MKFSALSFANAAATTGGILWIACALTAMLLPDLYKVAADLLSFGSGIGHFNLNLTSAVMGGLLFTGISWVGGYIFGWNLERFSKK